jgi:hypothetical protein
MKFIKILLLFLYSAVYVAGNTDTPLSYIDAGKITIETGSLIKIVLPYEKPENVLYIPMKDITAIIIDELIVDKKRRKARQLYFEDKRAVDKLDAEETIADRGQYFIEMNWFVTYQTVNKKKQTTEIFYKSETGNHLKKEQYTIPYGSKELFITYHIRFPNYPFNFSKDNVYSEKQTIRYELIWR